METIRNIYFIGIGGIGMSALARYFHEKGKVVSGYDRIPSDTTKMLEGLQIPIYFDIQTERIRQQDLVIYTPAIPADHPEYQQAQKLSIPVIKRSEALGLISKNYQTLAIAGTHGKTTTSSMLAHILYQGGMHSTAFLGGITKNYQSNYLTGDSPYAVVEADEYDKSFLQLQPHMAVITAMDADHLECYGSHASMQQAFMEFADQTDSQQPLLVSDRLSSLPWKRAIQTYGINRGDFQATNVESEQLTTTFDFVGEHIRINQVAIQLPGNHNISNMVAAMSIAHRVGLGSSHIKEGAETFQGIHRRFDVKFHQSSITYIDDYAHHPVEVEAIIQSIKTIFPTHYIYVIFQPHLYTRTQAHYKAFAEVLSLADYVYLMDIYPARELPIPGVNSEMIVNEITHNRKSLVSSKTLIEALEDMLLEPAVILTLGAGSIDREVEDICTWLHQTFIKKS